MEIDRFRQFFCYWKHSNLYLNPKTLSVEDDIQKNSWIVSHRILPLIVETRSMSNKKSVYLPIGLSVFSPKAQASSSVRSCYRLVTLWKQANMKTRSVTNSENQCFFLVCCCAPQWKKYSFIIKRWYFWNSFLFEFLCLWEKHTNFSLPEGRTCCWIQKRGHITYSSSRTALVGMFWEIFLLTSDCWLSGIRFGEYGSLLSAKTLHFFRDVLRERSFSGNSLIIIQSEEKETGNKE